MIGSYGYQSEEQVAAIQILKTEVRKQLLHMNNILKWAVEKFGVKLVCSIITTMTLL